LLLPPVDCVISADTNASATSRGTGSGRATPGGAPGAGEIEADSIEK
jgi:hypothetical protein